MKAQKIIIQDSSEIKNVLVQVNIKKGTTTVISNSSAWDNLAYLFEAVGVTVAKCEQDGRNKVEVLEEIKHYLAKVLVEKTIIF